jgi:Carboxypeptidase regulatory-like domain
MATTPGHATPQTTMNHRKLTNDAWTYNANIRAEDGPQPPRGWRALLDSLLIPVGFILALVLLCILISHSALAQTGSGRITGSVKDASGALISGSSVSLINTVTGVTQKTTSNAEGIFYSRRLRPDSMTEIKAECF